MMTDSFPRELGFMKECSWDKSGKVDGLIPDCRTLIDRVKSCINNKNNELPILLHSLFKTFQWLSLTLWIKSQILTRPLMYTLHDLDAGYCSDSHTGLYILSMSNRIPIPLQVLCVCHYLCLVQSFPIYSLGFLSPCFYFAQVSPDLIIILNSPI